MKDSDKANHLLDDAYHQAVLPILNRQYRAGSPYIQNHRGVLEMKAGKTRLRYDSPDLSFGTAEKAIFGQSKT
jgi:hypothetical protein